MPYAVQSGTPMENTQDANGGRPKYNLIHKKKKKNIPVRNKAIMGLNLWACLCMCNLK